MSMAYQREIDDPFTSSELDQNRYIATELPQYSSFGKEPKKVDLAKSKHTKSMNVLTKTDGVEKSKIALKLKPVQPRKKKKNFNKYTIREFYPNSLSSTLETEDKKNSRDLDQYNEIQEEERQEIERFITPVQPRIRNSILFSPQYEKYHSNSKPNLELAYLNDKNKIAIRNNIMMNQLFDSVNGNPIKANYFTTVSSPRAENVNKSALKHTNKSPSSNNAQNKIQINQRETNSAFKSVESIKIVNLLIQKQSIDDSNKRSCNTQEKYNFIHRIKQPTQEGENSRVSTIDTNAFGQNNKETADSQPSNDIIQNEQNFLLNAHKRTKKASNRYFNDERISLPTIKQNNEINKNTLFGTKRISCTKNLQKCFEGLNTAAVEESENDSSTNMPIDNYYYQTIDFDAVSRKQYKTDFNGKCKSKFKSKTRNNPGVIKFNSDYLRNMDYPNQYKFCLLSQDSETYKNSSNNLCDCETKGIKCYCNFLNLEDTFHNNQQKLVSQMLFKSQNVDNFPQMVNPSECHQNRLNIPETPTFSQRERN